MARPNRRADHQGQHRGEFEKNRTKIFATQSICALCGQPVDFNIKYPHPFSATVDHIIPIDRGGHPSALENLQLAHFSCNRAKSDKVLGTSTEFNQKKDKQMVGCSRNLPLSMDWSNY